MSPQTAYRTISRRLRLLLADLPPSIYSTDEGNPVVVVITNAACLCCQIEVHEINRIKGLDVRMSLVVALSTIQVTVCFGWVPTHFEGEHSKGSQEPPTSLSLPPT
ncbi:hypothetical protein TNCV_96301 [Trichonephila clavipes]|nr:hypothetical protein TNCV_96301 [Trichonephila clavipes]